MALDKVIDSEKLDADLTSVADAIRAKTGRADALAFPAGMVEVIAGISSGGGVTIRSGSFTPAENLLSIDIALGFEPKNFVFWKGTNNAGHGVRTAYGLWVIENAAVAHVGSNSSGTTIPSGISAEHYGVYLDTINSNSPPASYFAYADGTITITTRLGAGGGYLVPEKYNWIAW